MHAFSSRISGLSACLLWLLLSNVSSNGGTGLSVGNYVAPQSTALFPIQILVDGSGLFSEMVGAIQIRRKDSPSASNALPRIVAVSTAGSVWSTASGGVDLFYAVELGGSVLDPNIAVKTSGQGVKGPGVLLNLSLDLSTAALGNYEISISDTDLGDTLLALNGEPILTTTTTRGSLQVIPELRLTFTRTGNSWAIHFPVVGGAHYRLEARGALGVGDWNLAAELTVPTGTTQVSIPVSVLKETHTFFRVIKAPNP